MVTIGQVMNRRVEAVTADASVAETIALLTRNHIGGAPVVNDEGELVGIISELALIDVVFDASVKDDPVSKHMTVEVHAVRPEDPLSRAAQLFALYDFRRLPVVENDKLIGIISRRDLMNYALQSGQTITDPLFEIFPSLTVDDGCQQVEPADCA